MPITTISNITPLSKNFNHESVVSEAMILTNTIDNESVDIDNVRMHMNVSISYLVELLNAANKPFYGIWMKANLEDVLHPNGLPYIDLNANNGILYSDGTAATGIIPIQYIDKITAINIPNQDTGTNLIVPSGNVPYKTTRQLLQMSNRQNVQHKFTVSHCPHGNEIYFFIGQNINNILLNQSENKYTLDDTNDIIIHANRKPILDDLRFSVTDATGNYKNNIDLPDQYIDLLLKMIQKRILEQLRETIPQALEAQINQGLMNVAGSLQQEVQQERNDRIKTEYGPQQKSFYGTGQ